MPSHETSGFDHCPAPVPCTASEPKPPTGGEGEPGTGACDCEAQFTELLEKLCEIHDALVGDCDGGTTMECNCSVVYVAYDPAVHTADGIVGDGSESGPFQVPLPCCDPCAAFDQAPIACPDALDVLVSDGDACGPVALTDVMPGHSFAQCSAAGESMAVIGGAAPPPTLSQTEVGRDQIGELVFNNAVNAYPPIPAGTFPYTMTVPPSSPDCVLALHVVYGGVDSVTFQQSVNGPSIGANADLTNATLVADQPPAASRVGQAVWLFDPAAGTGGSMALDFATFIQGSGGVVNISWSEICDTTGASLSVADFDLGSLVQAGAVGGATQGEGEDSPPIDMGDCDAVYFGSARHVLTPGNTGSPTSNPAGQQFDSDWSQTSAGFPETYDWASVDCTVAPNTGCCQAGSSSALVPGGSGSWTWTALANNSNQAGVADNGKLMVLPLVCEDFVPEPVDSAEQCSIDITNTNCNVDGVVRCVMTGSVQVCVDDVSVATEVTVVPVVDGVEITSQAVGLSLPAWLSDTGPACTTFAVSFPITDLADVLAPGDQSTATFGWRASATAGTATVTTSDWSTECELIHV